MEKELLRSDRMERLVPAVQILVPEKLRMDAGEVFSCKQTNKQTNKQSNKQANKQTSKQTNNQTNARTKCNNYHVSHLIVFICRRNSNCTESKTMQLHRPTNNYHTYVTPDHFHLQENQQLQSRRHWESLQRGTPWVCFEHMGQ